MLPNLKDLFELKKHAGAIQKSLATEQIEIENHGIIVAMNGNQEVLKITINTRLSTDEQEKYLLAALNDCLKKTKELMARKMMSNDFNL